jgi:hypothetical protein
MELKFSSLSEGVHNNGEPKFDDIRQLELSIGIIIQLYANWA